MQHSTKTVIATGCVQNVWPCLQNYLNVILPFSIILGPLSRQGPVLCDAMLLYEQARLFKVNYV